MDRYIDHAIKCLEAAKEKAQDNGFCTITVAEIEMYLHIIKERKESNG